MISKSSLEVRERESRHLHVDKEHYKGQGKVEGKLYDLNRAQHESNRIETFEFICCTALSMRYSNLANMNIVTLNDIL
jgi:hypothetical protein